MRILLLNLDSESSQTVEQALSGQGYEISAGSAATVDEILAGCPGVVITEATPSDLSCCSVISQIKASPDPRTPRIVMVVHGGALERARGLDLGADDVISFPFDPLEFAARIRTQFREREPELALEAKLNQALTNERLAESAVEALSGTNGKRRFGLTQALVVLAAAVILAALALVISNRHSRKDTLQLKAEVARLNGGLLQQDELLRRADQARASFAAKDASETREGLKAQAQEIRKKMAANGDGNDSNDSLEKQLQETQLRLSRLENEGRVAETIVHTYGPSICLLHVVMQFRDNDSGKLIRILTDAAGKPQVDDKGMVSLDTEGTGPLLQVDVFGTGFLVSHDGRLLTNHHVAEPWWSNDELKPVLDHGATAFAESYTAYFPGAPGITANLDRISAKADVATLKLQAPPPPHTALLELDDRKEASISGEPVVLIGYPTGIDGILARAGSDATQKLVENVHEVSQLVSQLAAQHLIRPTTTQGHIGDVLADKIVYDAATTSGGSGGPLFNREGKVIGVNFAILTDFGGSNLAVPVRYADELLK